ncbi:MAG TPA: hypothetical protein PKY82_01865 [Pyrinomonadaceae bacterium]|nr:hypothetical protein [Pyrinomonadaceae bacterium]
MFPRYSLWMVFTSGALMIAGCLVNYFTGNQVNIWLLGLGLLLLIYGTAMLLFYKPK